MRGRWRNFILSCQMQRRCNCSASVPLAHVFIRVPVQSTFFGLCQFQSSNTISPTHFSEERVFLTGSTNGVSHLASAEHEPSRLHIYKPYPDRTEARNRAI
ncbi:hypothetical protein AVEN_265374-1 [Araneus ventricosus]|uniref:Uncharacterized protein n=1 Tax=Araneus ventricosus TaxID=182803 RepID=A0A4Y2IR39_ARAVE|nr:hypothetical protein AVEN_265374-1 [Araneus ventricosus]